jgi:hypothetical protein
MAGLTSALRFLVLAALLVPPSAASAQGHVVELRLTTRGGAGVEVLSLASETAIQLLRSAGIEAVWRDCSASVCPEDASRHPVLVHLLPVVKRGKPAVSGEFLRDGRTRTPTLLVYLPRLAATASEVRRLPESRTNPVLLTLQPSHLIGLTIAHEVGHSLGLGHTDLGVMAARPSVREIVELRTARLAFDDRESSRMRVALANEFALLAAARD